MLTVTQEAADWLKQELSLNQGGFLRFYAMLYGNEVSIHPNFSLGIAKEAPVRIGIQTVVDGITYYLEESDRWYLDHHHLTVNVSNDDLQYVFTPL